MSEVIGKNVLAEWLARLKRGRDWQRQAGQKKSWEDLIGGDLLDLVSEAATGKRPSERDISLLLGVKPDLSRINGRPAAGVRQHFNGLSRRPPARRGTFELSPRQEADWPFAATENLAPAVLKLNHSEAKPEKKSNQFLQNTENRQPTKPAKMLAAAAEDKLKREPDLMSLTDDETAAEIKAEAKAQAGALAENQIETQTEAEIGTPAPSDIGFDMFAGLGAVAYENKPARDRPELMFYSGLEEHWAAEPEPAAAAAAKILTAERLSAPSAALSKAAAEPPGAETDANRLTELVAERLREDIEALLGSASLV